MFKTIILASAVAMCSAQGTKNIVELAASVPDLSTLVTAVKAAGLVDTLSGPGPFTVFAPTNQAFAELPPGVLADLLKPENKAVLVKVLTYHVVAGSVHSNQLTNDELVKTVEGDNVTVHVFTRGPEKRVLIEDREPNARWANVIKADVDASNGVVHIIDRVLIPGKLTPTPKPQGNKTIVELAIATPALSTLVTAVKAAGLVDTLSGKGPFTVFAPTNDAFNALPPGVLANLLKPENKAELVKILTFHVVAANVQAEAVREGEVITTVEGGHLLAHVRDYQGERHIFLQDDIAARHFAEVIQGNVEASNGVVHVIDRVLIPPARLLQLA